MVASSNRGRSGRSSLVRPILVGAALGLFFQKKVRHLLLPYGPAMSVLDPRLVRSAEQQLWYTPFDPTNDSLRFHHGRSYKIVDVDPPEAGHTSPAKAASCKHAAASASLLRGPETVLVHPIDQSVYVLTDAAQLIQLLHLPKTLQEEKALLASIQNNYTYKAATAVIQADLGPGRPLGGCFTPDGTTLYITDAVLGLTRLQDFKNPNSRIQVLASRVPIVLEKDEDTATEATAAADETVLSPISLANSVVVGPKTGKVYFTDATDIPPDRLQHVPSSKRCQDDTTTKQQGRPYSWDILHVSKMDLARGKPTGRVLEYDPATGQSRVLADQIHFANGISVDHEETVLVVGETFNTNILRYKLPPPSPADQDPGATSNSNNQLLKPSQYLQPEVLIPTHEFTGYVDNLSCGYHPDQKKTICYGAIIGDFVPIDKLLHRLPNLLSILVRTLILILPRTWAPELVPQYTGVVVFDPFMTPPAAAHHHQPDQHKKNTKEHYYFIQDPSGQDLVQFTGATVTPDHRKLYLGSLTNQYVGVYLLQQA